MCLIIPFVDVGFFLYYILRRTLKYVVVNVVMYVLDLVHAVYVNNHYIISKDKFD